MDKRMADVIELYNRTLDYRHDSQNSGYALRLEQWLDHLERVYGEKDTERFIRIVTKAIQKGRLG